MRARVPATNGAKLRNVSHGGDEPGTAVEGRACSAVSFGLVLLSLLLPLVTVSSCGSDTAKTTTTGVGVLVGTELHRPTDPRPSAPQGIRPIVMGVIVAAVTGLFLVAYSGRRAAVGRLLSAIVGALITVLLAVAIQLGSLFDESSVGPGYWLGLLGFLAAGVVETVGLVSFRHRVARVDDNELRLFDLLFRSSRWRS